MLESHKNAEAALRAIATVDILMYAQDFPVVFSKCNGSYYEIHAKVIENMPTYEEWWSSLNPAGKILERLRVFSGNGQSYQSLLHTKYIRGRVLGMDQTLANLAHFKNTRQYRVEEY